MLSDYDVLKYIKDNVSAPFSYFEKDDEEILDYVKRYTLKKQFSTYIPNEYLLYVDEIEKEVPNSNRTKYYLTDPDDCTIFTVKKMYFSNTDIVLGHPVIGVFSFNELENFALKSFEAMTAKQFSVFDYVWQFNAPNIIRIAPSGCGSFSALYEREHPGFYTVPAQHEFRFLKLALAEVNILIGNLRTKFGTISTPVGEINLNGADIYQKGVEARDKILEELNGLPPNNILDLI